MVLKARVKRWLRLKEAVYVATSNSANMTVPPAPKTATSRRARPMSTRSLPPSRPTRPTAPSSSAATQTTATPTPAAASPSTSTSASPTPGSPSSTGASCPPPTPRPTPATRRLATTLARWLTRSCKWKPYHINPPSWRCPSPMPHGGGTQTVKSPLTLIMVIVTAPEAPSASRPRRLTTSRASLSSPTATSSRTTTRCWSTFPGRREEKRGWALYFWI